jgi:hypothetical protein
MNPMNIPKARALKQHLPGIGGRPEYLIHGRPPAFSAVPGGRLTPRLAALAAGTAAPAAGAAVCALVAALDPVTYGMTAILTELPRARAHRIHVLPARKGRA